MGTYLDVLEESLYKKLGVLEKVQAYNEKQYKCFSAEQVDIEGFDEAIEEKGKLIEEINQLDEGFEILYANLAKELENNREQYAPQIMKLKGLIKQVTEKSVLIQAQESRNKALIETYFAKEKSQIKEGRKNSQAAYGYYKNLNKAILEDSHAFDLKQ
ncbi:MAG: flagellar export chaperone FlgN [Lachnospiraceae bacterium]|nr:flagellar export chaperone FlgN [Lachnospiraceae bacterium]